MPFLAMPGTAWQQSRTFTGEPGTPGAGLTGYEYRLSMTQAAGFSDCVLGLVLDFGPVEKLPYTTGYLVRCLRRDRRGRRNRRPEVG